MSGRKRVAFTDITYGVEDGIAVISLNRPRYRNAQSWRMLDEIDAAFDLAHGDPAARVVLVKGSGGVFSTGHDLGTPEGAEYRKAQIGAGGLRHYDAFKKYNLDLLLKWRNFEKPTIAMVEGYCIYAGWMLAAAMDVVFATEAAEYGLVNRVPPKADLERETFAWARRVAENDAGYLRLAKLQMNKAQD